MVEKKNLRIAFYNSWKLHEIQFGVHEVLLECIQIANGYFDTVLKETA